MAGQRRGFSSERHTYLKVALAVVGVAGFALGWAGFANSHADGPATDPVPSPAPTQATSPTATQRPGSTPVATVVVPTGTAGPPLPETPPARRSRGS